MFDRILRWRSRRKSIAKQKRRLPRRWLHGFEAMEPRVLLAGAEIAVFDGVTEIVSGTTVAIDFGAVVQGAVGPTRTFTIENDGDDTLTLGAIQLPAGFSLLDGTSSNILVRGSDTFTVRLDSSSLGVKTGSISFNTNDSDENPFRFAITGTVLAGGPEIAVFDGATGVVDGSVVAIDIGAAVQGTLGPRRSFTVRNTGTQPLTLGTVDVPPGFILTEGLPPSLPPGGSDHFSIQLATNAVGTRTGDIVFITNDADENPFNFRIQGTVTSFNIPEITVLDGLVPITDGGLVPIDFGDAVQDAAPIVRTFTVRNDGNDTLSLGPISVPAGFKLVEGLPSSLVPRATDSFTVQLETADLGTPAGEISFFTNDTDESPFNFPITGNVVAAAPEIRVMREDLLELTDGGPPIETFASVGAGLPGSTRSFAVVNIGTATLTLGAITLPAGFALVDGLPASLAPGISDVFTVQLVTTAEGVQAGDILIASDDGDENPFNIPVTGTVLAAAPEISVQTDGVAIVDGSTTPIPFGDGVLRDPNPQRVFTVRNLGTTPLSLGPITLPDGFILFEGLPATLAPGAADSFTVQLAAASARTITGEISIENNDLDENPFNFLVTSRVTQTAVPEIAVFDGATELENGVSPTIDFGAVTRRQKGPRRTFTIRNDGSDTLRVRRVELPAGFSLVTPPRRSLAPRGIDTFVVRLDSKKIGVKGGEIRIFSDDADESVFRISVLGTVVA